MVATMKFCGVGRLALLCGAACLAACAGSVGSPGDPDPDEMSGGTGGADRPATPTPETPVLGGNEKLTCDAAAGKVPGPARAWRLTRVQYDNTVRDLLGDDTAPAKGFLPESGVNGFSNNAFALRVRDQDAGLIRAAAKALAAATVDKRLAKVFACDPSKLADATCEKSFITAFGARAFRRPLSGEEVTRYTALYDLAKAREPKLGPQAVIEAMLQSPNFLFRGELGEAGAAGQKARLTAHEIASALSYTLLDTMPDPALLQAAADGKLATTAQVEAQARRLLGEAGARPALARFFLQLTEYDRLDNAIKDPVLHSGFDALKPDLRRETELFVQDVVFDGAGDLQALLTAEYSFMNAAIGKLHGVTVAGTTLVKTPTQAGRRAGLLTQPGLLAVLAKDVRTSPVDRGRFVRERMLCDVLNDPPPDVDLSVPPAAQNETRRQQLDRLTGAPQCQACHGLINPIGFGLESFDEVGAFRSVDNGQPIETSGELAGTRDADGAFGGAAALAGKLAGSAQVRECFAIQQFRYALGRAETLGDSCAIKAAYDKFAGQSFDWKELVVALVTTDAFLFRQK